MCSKTSGFCGKAKPTNRSQCLSTCLKLVLGETLCNNRPQKLLVLYSIKQYRSPSLPVGIFPRTVPGFGYVACDHHQLTALLLLLSFVQNCCFLPGVHIIPLFPLFWTGSGNGPDNVWMARTSRWWGKPPWSRSPHGAGVPPGGGRRPPNVRPAGTRWGTRRGTPSGAGEPPRCGRWGKAAPGGWTGAWKRWGNNNAS